MIATMDYGDVDKEKLFVILSGLQNVDIEELLFIVFKIMWRKLEMR